jgi:hypothetical protein
MIRGSDDFLDHRAPSLDISNLGKVRDQALAHSFIFCPWPDDPSCFPSLKIKPNSGRSIVRKHFKKSSALAIWLKPIGGDLVTETPKQLLQRPWRGTPGPAKGAHGSAVKLHRLLIF